MKLRGIIRWLGFMALFALLVPMAAVNADGGEDASIAVRLNGENVSLAYPPVIENDTLFVPVRGLLEKLGWTIMWYPEGQTIVAEKKTANRYFMLKMSIGYNRGAFNGEMYDTPVVPRLIGESAYMYAGYLSRLGLNVDWDAAKRILTVDEPKPEDTFVYLNGSRYEGEMFGGVPNGHGKLYSADGRLIYEGEFVNGLAHGEGKLYDKDGQLVYAGSFHHERKHGHGRLYRPDGSLEFEGEFVYGEKSPFGNVYTESGVKIVRAPERYGNPQTWTIVYPNGAMFQGTFSGLLAEGEGKLVSLAGETVAEGRFRAGTWKAERSEGDGQPGKTVTVSVTKDGYYRMVERLSGARSYENATHMFSVRLPDNWSDKPLEIVEEPNRISFFYAAPSGRNLPLVTVKVYDEREWNADPGNPPDNAKLLKAYNGLVYAYISPGNVQPQGDDLEEADVYRSMLESSERFAEAFRPRGSGMGLRPEDVERSAKDVWRKFLDIEQWTLSTAGAYPEGVLLNASDKLRVIALLRDVYDERMAERMFLRQNRPVDGGYEPIPIDYTSIRWIGDDLQVERDKTDGSITVTISGGGVEVRYTLDAQTGKITDYRVVRSNY